MQPSWVGACLVSQVPWLRSFVILIIMWASKLITCYLSVHIGEIFKEMFKKCNFLLSSDIRSQGSIAIVKIFDFDFFYDFSFYITPTV